MKYHMDFSKLNRPVFDIGAAIEKATDELVTKAYETVDQQLDYSRVASRELIKLIFARMSEAGWRYHFEYSTKADNSRIYLTGQIQWFCNGKKMTWKDFDAAVNQMIADANEHDKG